MAEYIDRAEAQTELQFAFRRYTVAHEAHGEGRVVWSEDLVNVTDAMNALRKVPTADVRENKRGKWIDEGFYADGHGAHAFRCSECGEHIIEYDPDPFCRFCGADMRKEYANDN